MSFWVENKEEATELEKKNGTNSISFKMEQNSMRTRRISSKNKAAQKRENQGKRLQGCIKLELIIGFTVHTEKNLKLRS